MLNPITMKGRSNMLTPDKDSITAKKSVDNPIIAAKVPIREKRSFHKLKNLSSIMLYEISDAY